MSRRKGTEFATLSDFVGEGFMNKGLKFLAVVSGFFVLLLVGSIAFVTPRHALSSAIMRNCIDLVRNEAPSSREVTILSAAAIQPDPNKKKLEDFNRVTQSVMSRGDMVHSEPQVLVEFKDSSGSGSAVCMYHSSYFPKGWAYESVSLQDAQVGVRGVSMFRDGRSKAFKVGYFDRLISLVPMFGVERKFFLD